MLIEDEVIDALTFANDTKVGEDGQGLQGRRPSAVKTFSSGSDDDLREESRQTPTRVRAREKDVAGKKKMQERTRAFCLK